MMRTLCNLLTWRQSSPAMGSSFQPVVSTGEEGGAERVFPPFSLCMDLTLHQVSPATSTSPTCSVPCWTTTVAVQLRRGGGGGIATPL